MSLPEDLARFTFELQSRGSGEAIITQLQYSDFLDTLVSSRLLSELDTPSNLSTQLLPYVFPMNSPHVSLTQTGINEKLYTS
jgi:hypothetical protein